MPKLNLKRTPVEAAHQARKRKRKDAKRRESHGSEQPSLSRTYETATCEWPSTDDDDEPSSSTSTSWRSRRLPPLQPHHIQTEIEDLQFRERMFDALGDDERLDALETRFNDYAHVPGRWRTSKASKDGYKIYNDQDDFLRMDPHTMDDEEYAEWIRLGMYRKSHAVEYAEQERQRTLKAERRAAKMASKLETRRLEKLAKDEMKLRRLGQERRRKQHAREEYEMRWKKLLSDLTDDNPNGLDQKLGFHDIPWPISVAYHNKMDRRTLSLEDLTQEAIIDFLFPTTDTATNSSIPPGGVKKGRKDRLRETFLRFHPDKFEGRFIKHVKETERDAVREAIGQIARCLNSLMGENT